MHDAAFFNHIHAYSLGIISRSGRADFAGTKGTPTLPPKSVSTLKGWTAYSVKMADISGDVGPHCAERVLSLMEERQSLIPNR